MTKILKITKRYLSICFFTTILTSILPIHSYAGDAKGYITPPDGTAGVLFYWQQKTANRYYSNGNLVTKDGDYDMDLKIIRPIYYKEIGGYMTSLQALLPFGTAKVNGSRTSGTGDPTILMAIWPVADKENQLWFGISEWISMPLGKYDRERLSLGSNRWGFKTEASLTKGFGKLIIEITPSIEFYTKNNDYLLSNHKTSQKMDPLFRTETHISYDFTDTFMLSFDYFYKKGGELEASDWGFVEKKGKKDDHSVQLTAGIRLAPKHQILIQYLRDIKVENGFKQDQFGLRYFFVF